MDGLSVIADLAEAKLNQVLGLEPASRPAVALLKLDAEQVVRFFKFAVFYASLAAVALELKRNKSVRRNRFFEFKTGTRRGYIFEDCPFAAGRTEFRFPLHLDQIRTKLSIFSSFSSHD
jgi:hypothetical protein